jgi:RNase P/RNase MRP subunit POP5
MEQIPQFSHHIGVKFLMGLLNTLYNKHPKYILYSILSNSFEKIQNAELYKESINAVVKELAGETKT